MRKTILALVGVALVAGSTTQFAYAKQQHHARHAPQYAKERFYNSNAAIIPVAPRVVFPAAPQTGSGGMGGWGSMTGFD